MAIKICTYVLLGFLNEILHKIIKCIVVIEGLTLLTCKIMKKHPSYKLFNQTHPKNECIGQKSCYVLDDLKFQPIMINYKSD